MLSVRCLSDCSPMQAGSLTWLGVDPDCLLGAQLGAIDLHVVSLHGLDFS